MQSRCRRRRPTVCCKRPGKLRRVRGEFFWAADHRARLRSRGRRPSRPRVSAPAIESYGVTVVHFVPSMLASFLVDAQAAGGEQETARCAAIRHIVVQWRGAASRAGPQVPGHAAAGELATTLYGPPSSVDVTAWQCTATRLKTGHGSPSGRRSATCGAHSRHQDAGAPIGAPASCTSAVSRSPGATTRPALTPTVRARPVRAAGLRLYATGRPGPLVRGRSVESLAASTAGQAARTAVELGEIEADAPRSAGVRDARPSGRSSRRQAESSLHIGDGEHACSQTARGTKRPLPDYMGRHIRRVQRCRCAPAGKLTGPPCPCRSPPSHPAGNERRRAPRQSAT